MGREVPAQKQIRSDATLGMGILLNTLTEPQYRLLGLEPWEVPKPSVTMKGGVAIWGTTSQESQS